MTLYLIALRIHIKQSVHKIQYNLYASKIEYFIAKRIFMYL